MTFMARIKSALPPPWTALAGAFAWALAMSASAIISIYLRHWYRPLPSFELVAIFFAGGLVAWPLARFASRLIAPPPFGSRRMAADILGTSALTLAVTAFFFVLHFRWHSAHHHAEFLSVPWIITVVFTFLSVTYQFLVLGLGLFLPALVVMVPAYLFWVMFAARR